MAKLTEIENEAALDLAMNILDPAAELMQDKKLIELLRGPQPKLVAVRFAIENHKHAIVEILAALDQVPVEEYHGNIITMTKSLLELIQDKELLELFGLQSQTEEGNAPGSRMENTEAKEN